MLTVNFILALLALLLAAAAPTNYVPLWVSVILLAILALLQTLPFAR